MTQLKRMEATLTQKDIADLITIYRRAPLSNMDEAEAAAQLLQRAVQFLTTAKLPKPKNARKAKESV